MKIGRKAQNDSFPYPETTIRFWHTLVPVKLVIYLKNDTLFDLFLNMVEGTRRMTVFLIQKRRFAFDIHLSLSNWSFLWKMTLFRPIFCRRTRRNTKFVRFSSFLRAKSNFFKKTLKISAPNSFFQNEPIFFYLFLDFSASFECLKVRRLGERNCEDWKKSAEWQFSLTRNDDWLLT